MNPSTKKYKENDTKAHHIIKLLKTGIKTKFLKQQPRKLTLHTEKGGKNGSRLLTGNSAYLKTVKQHP
jgi:hypothetical protein